MENSECLQMKKKKELFDSKVRGKGKVWGEEKKMKVTVSLKKEDFMVAGFCSCPWEGRLSYFFANRHSW